MKWGKMGGRCSFYGSTDLILVGEVCSTQRNFSKRTVDCQVNETGLKVAAEVERSCAGEHRLSSWSHDLLGCCAGPLLHIQRMMYGVTAYLL
jgi:hypothetical protein